MAIEPLEYAILPSDRARGRQHPEILDVRTGTTWTMDVAMNALAAHALSWHLQGQAWANAKHRATKADVQAWVDHTRSLADLLPIGATVREMMHQTAARLESTLTSPLRFFINWPALGTQADANGRASIHLWAIDRLLRAVNEAEVDQGHRSGCEHLEFPVTKIWPAMFEGAEPTEPSFTDYKEAMKRIDRLDGRILDGQHDALLVTTLAATLTVE